MISHSHLRSAEQVISQPLSMLINKLIECRTYPSKLKLAKIILIYKSGDESDPAGPPIIDPYRFSPSLTVSLTKQLALLPALDTLYP